MQDSYVYQLIVNLTVSMQLILSGLFFLHPLKKQRPFALRLVLSFICCALVYTAAVWMRMLFPTLITRFVMRLMQFYMPLIISFFAYDCQLFVRIKVIRTNQFSFLTFHKAANFYHI